MIKDFGIKLLLAMLVGGIIGVEREFHDKAAGFRTITFICVGAMLFTIFSLSLGDPDDPVRIAASIVSGIGFIGAGVIIRDGGQVRGLTTATTIWIAAALGMGIGGGYYLTTGAATIVILVGLWIYPLINRAIHKTHETRTYRVLIPASPEKFDQLQEVIKQCGLRVEQFTRERQHDVLSCKWRVYGHQKDHEHFVDWLISDGDLLKFQY
jgi:putative Mg2+ transporter-C (MgtC) family protein